MVAVAAGARRRVAPWRWAPLLRRSQPDAPRHAGRPRARGAAGREGLPGAPAVDAGAPRPQRAFHARYSSRCGSLCSRATLHTRCPAPSGALSPLLAWSAVWSPRGSSLTSKLVRLVHLRRFITLQESSRAPRSHHRRRRAARAARPGVLPLLRSSHRCVKQGVVWRKRSVFLTGRVQGVLRRVAL
jgi:hypothetical protein